jgi:thioesterase domain-containing protein
VPIDGGRAFEVARQLAAAGETVALLALFDTPCPAILGPDSPAAGWRTRWSILRWQAGFQWISLRQLGRREVPGYVGERLAALCRHCAAGLRSRLVGREQGGKAWAGRYDPSGVRLRIATYDCQPYSGALTLFCAEDSLGAGFARAPAYGWNGMAAGGVRVHTVPGNHVTMFLKPNVERLALILAQELAGAAPPAGDDAARSAVTGSP